MISVRVSNRIVSKFRMALGLTLAVAALGVGRLAISTEHAVLLTQRFSPDAVHNIPLELKGKIFYASATEAHEYYFYQHLFISGIVIGIIFVIVNLMWDGYRKKAHAIGPSAKDQK